MTLIEEAEQQQETSLILMKESILESRKLVSSTKITQENFSIVDNETGINHYPQLFIPSYKKVKGTSESPLIVFYMGIDLDRYKAYHLDDDNIYKKGNWPAANRSATIRVDPVTCYPGVLTCPASRSLNITYRSSNSLYDAGNIYYEISLSPPNPRLACSFEHNYDAPYRDIEWRSRCR
ncbi:MAG: hypothetical protein AAGF85_14965 [Bacteroidota bacterium]